MINKISKPKYLTIFFVFLLVIFALHLFYRIYQYSNNYKVIYDSNYWEKRYYESQWAVPNSKVTIGDDGLYAYAGYKYVFDGLNPILNSAEVPPLGKYLVGYTILFFGNQNIFGVITGIAALILFYIFNLQIFKKKLIAFIPVFIFSFDKLFYEQLQANYLDLLYLSFLLLAFIFAIKRRYVLASIAIGCFAATKFPPVSFLVALTVFIYVIVNNRRDILKLILSLTAWPVVFMATYVRFFILGNNFFDFLRVLKYFINYYSTGAKSINHIMVFDMLIFGRWQTWWGSILKVEEWNSLWPLSLLLSTVAIKDIKSIVKSPIFINIIWIPVYLIFLLIVPVAPRYLLLLIPFLYNVAVWVLLRSIGKKSLL